MGRITLVTGGCRSGKSRYAQQLAEQIPGQRLLLATCPVLDDEMRDRVARHRRDREGRGWKTLEAPVDLAGALGAATGTTVLVDCLTLWVSNLMHQADQQGVALDEPQMAARAEIFIDAARRCDGYVVAVTNEVGMGTVPAHAVARRFRDLAGRCNQRIAAGADEVVWMVSGIPVPIKGPGMSEGEHGAA